MTAPATHVRRVFAAPTPVTALSFARGEIRAKLCAMSDGKRFPVRWVAARKVWEIDARPHGRIYSVRIPGVARPIRFVAREIAEEIREAILADIERGVAESAALAQYLPGKSKLSDWAHDWIEHLERLAKQGRRSPRYIRRLRDFADPGGHWQPLYDAGLSIYAIDYAKLEDFALDLAERGMGDTTLVHCMASLQTCLRWAAKRIGTGYAPPEFPALERGKFEPVRLTRAQQDAVLAEIREDLRGIFIAMTDLMIRPGEARALLVRHYDFNARELHVAEAIKGPRKGDARGTTKEGDTRRLLVTERLHAWLEAHVPATARLRRDVELFTNPRALNGDARWDENTMYGVWVAARDRAKVPPATMYSGTKHSTATWLRGLGLTLDEIGVALGHSTPRERRVTEGYAGRPDVANGRIVALLDRREA